METQFERVTGYKLVGLGACMEWIRAVLLPLGHSSAGATRSVPSPRRCPSTSRSHDTPTIPASDGGGLYTGYRSGSPMGRGWTTPSQVPTTKKGCRYRRCPRCRPEYGGAEDSSPRSGRENLEGPALHGAPPRNVVVPSLGGGFPPEVPFPLQDHEGQLQAIRTLYEEARENRLASEMTALCGLQEGHPELGAEELQRLNNQVLLMIAEYHLTSASQGTHHVLPVLPEGATQLMPPLEDYFQGRSMVAATLESRIGPRSCVLPSGCTTWISTPRMAWRSPPHPGWRTTILGPSWNIF